MLRIASRLEGFLDGARFASDELKGDQILNKIVNVEITRLCEHLPAIIEELYAIGQG